MKRLLILGLLLTGCTTSWYRADQIDMQHKVLVLGVGHYNDAKDMLASGVLDDYDCKPASITQDPPGFYEFHRIFVQCK